MDKPSNAAQPDTAAPRVAHEEPIGVMLRNIRHEPNAPACRAYVKQLERRVKELEAMLAEVNTGR